VRQRLAGPVHPNRGVVGRDALLDGEVLDRDAVDFDPCQRLGVFGLERFDQLAHAAAARVDGIQVGLAGREGSLRFDQIQRPLAAITAAMALDACIAQHPIEPRGRGRRRTQLRELVGALGKCVLHDVLGHRSLTDSALDKREELAALAGEFLQESGDLRGHRGLMI
jgi:hypothetical protein